MTNAKMYKLGHDFGIETLQDAAQELFLGNIRELVSLLKKMNPPSEREYEDRGALEQVREVVKFIYTEISAEGSGMRDVLISSISECLAYLAAFKKFKELLWEFPELAADILLYMCKGYKDSNLRWETDRICGVCSLGRCEILRAMLVEGCRDCYNGRWER